MDRLRLATIWLSGCSGCHMSFLDMDEFLLELADLADVVFSPIADVKHFPEGVDVTLVEGAVANEDNLRELLEVRRRTKLLLALGDCAITGNVPAMRNPLGDPGDLLHRVYVESADAQGQLPLERGILPPLLPAVRPVHELVKVDGFIRGCPPSAADIRRTVEELLGALPVETSAAAVGRASNSEEDGNV